MKRRDNCTSPRGTFPIKNNFWLARGVTTCLHRSCNPYHLQERFRYVSKTNRGEPARNYGALSTAWNMKGLSRRASKIGSRANDKSELKISVGLLSTVHSLYDRYRLLVSVTSYLRRSCTIKKSSKSRREKLRRMTTDGERADGAGDGGGDG